jgi:hypothetical protein
MMQRSLNHASSGSGVTNPAVAQRFVKGSWAGGIGLSGGKGLQAALQAEGEAAKKRVLEAEAGDPVAEPVVLSDDAAVFVKPRLA